MPFPSPDLFPSPFIFPGDDDVVFTAAGQVVSADLPHFNTTYGFRFGSNGKPVVCEQDSAADVESCVINVLDCPLGGYVADATFGVEIGLFHELPLDTAPIMNAIQEWEPRAHGITIQDLSTIANQQLGKTQILVQAETGPEG